MLLDIFLALMQTFMAVVATVIAINQRREQKYDMRVEDLKKLVKSLNTERYWYYAAAQKYYHAALADHPTGVADYVLYERAWMQPDGDDHFVPLEDIVVHIPEHNLDIWNTDRNPKAPFLPTKADGYAENAKFHCGTRLMNMPLYALERFERAPDNRIHLYIKKGYYFDFYDTCEIMSAEMAYYRRIKTKKNLTPGHLPIRDSVKDIFDLTNRFAGIGIITLTILKNVISPEGELRHYFLVHKRSQNVAEGTGSYHAIPAGSYQPVTVEFPLETDPIDLNLGNTVTREFGEELLGIDEFENLYNSTLLSAGPQLPKPLFIGIGLDPLNLKTELMSCLMIDVAADARVLRGKTTYQEIDEFLTGTYEGSVSLKELTVSMLRQFSDNPMSIPSFRQILKTVEKHKEHFGVRDV